MVRETEPTMTVRGAACACPTSDRTNHPPAPCDARLAVRPSPPCPSTRPRSENARKMRGVYVIFARCAASLEPLPDALRLCELRPMRCVYVRFARRAAST